MNIAEITKAVYESSGIINIGYFYENPTIAVMGLAFALAFISVLLIYLYQLRERIQEQHHTKELSTFIAYVCYANEKVCEIDMARKKINDYRISNGKVIKEEKSFDEYNDLGDRIFSEDIEKVRRQCNVDMLNGIIDTTGEAYFECRTKVSGGEYHWCSCLIQGIPKDKKHPRSAMLYMRDIDAKKREDEAKSRQIQEALDIAQKASEAKGVFMSRMSHEIRTPLNAVIGYMTIAQEPDCSIEKMHDCVDKSKIAAKHLMGIVNDVLDISAIESGKFKLSEEIFDLRRMIAEISSIVANQAKQKGISFETNIHRLTQEKLIGDELRTNQILINLLSNAIKFTPEGGRVSLGVHEDGITDGTVNMSFTVSDTGMGISEEFLGKIFMPFEQQDASVAKNYGGTGLGLAISKNLVSILGGEISVRSESNRGTEFKVIMPFRCCDQNCSIETTDVDSFVKYDFSGKRALLAEDIDMNIEIAVEFLKQGGFAIDVVRNGQEAYRRFIDAQPGTYQVVLMDIQMPVLNGYEAAKKIRLSKCADAGTVPIIAMTADAFEEDIAHVRESGMNDCIFKPIDIRQMYKTLAKYVL